MTKKLVPKKSDGSKQGPANSTKGDSESKAKKPALSRRDTICGIIGFLIGVIGGVPGFLTLKRHYDRSSTRIIFDRKNTIICRTASSPNPKYENKFSILLYVVTIVGTGDDKFVANDVVISVRSNGIWHNGIRFVPVKHTETDRNGITKKVLKAYVGVKKPPTQNSVSPNSSFLDTVGNTLSFVDWNDFSPGVSVAYGEPIKFSVANYFPNPPSNFSSIDKMRIKVFDYLGNSFSEEYDFQPNQALNRPTLYLDLDSDLVSGHRWQ